MKRAKKRCLLARAIIIIIASAHIAPAGGTQTPIADEASRYTGIRSALPTCFDPAAECQVTAPRTPLVRLSSSKRRTTRCYAASEITTPAEQISWQMRQAHSSCEDEKSVRRPMFSPVCFLENTLVYDRRFVCY